MEEDNAQGWAHELELEHQRYEEMLFYDDECEAFMKLEEEISYGA